MKDFNNVIEVSGVSKYFKVYYDRGTTLKDRILSRGRNRYERREVLKGISFEVKKGEAIGLIGKNGCGKSTTLKLLTRIIYPNAGTIELSGRVSSLLELGAGFHPDMSGRENIYMNAAVFGLTKKEIDQRLDDIIQFSEMEDFIDNPVRTYSSGMYMRLAFSVAINVDADILLIDEILAVGDISFQKKCFEKLQEIKAGGATIVIVSHSLDQIEKICDRTIWIEDGMIREVGKTKEVHRHYLFDMEQIRLQRFQREYYETLSDGASEAEYGGTKHEEAEYGEAKHEETEHRNAEQETEYEVAEAIQEQAELESGLDAVPADNSVLKAEIQRCKQNFLTSSRKEKCENRVSGRIRQKVVYTEMYITNTQNEESVVFKTGEDINIYLKYKADEPGLRGNVCLLIYSDDGTYCYGTNYFIEAEKLFDFQRVGIVKIILHEIPLLAGKYFFTVSLHNEEAQEYETLERVAAFQVFSDKYDQGVARIKSQWQCGKE